MRMTSLIFTGQNYALHQFASTPHILQWRAAEANEHPSDRHNDENQESGEEVPHAGNVRKTLPTCQTSLKMFRFCLDKNVAFLNSVRHVLLGEWEGLGVGGGCR